MRPEVSWRGGGQGPQKELGGVTPCAPKLKGTTVRPERGPGVQAVLKVITQLEKEIESNH